MTVEAPDGVRDGNKKKIKKGKHGEEPFICP